MQINYKATSREKSDEKYQNALKTDVFLQKLANASFADIDNWVDSNVGNIKQAKALFKKMLLMMSYLINK